MIVNQSGFSPADRNHKMDFAGFLESVAKFQRTWVPINHHGNGRAQSISITQAFFEAGMKFVQILDHVPNRITLYNKRPLPVRKITQQRWNPNDRQMIILRAYEVPQRCGLGSWAM